MFYLTIEIDISMVFTLIDHRNGVNMFRIQVQPRAADEP